jgi:hypothetical protein
MKNKAFRLVVALTLSAFALLAVNASPSAAGSAGSGGGIGGVLRISTLVISE